MHESYLIQDLTTIIVIAGAVSVIFSILRWPSILGYLLSGLIVGPYVTAKFSIHDASSVKSISELGVIFLMFCIGLEFDLKKLKQTLFPSLLAMLFQALTAFFIGTTVAHVIGWSPVLGIFLGAIFAISSTMVAIPIIKQQNAMQQPFAQFTMGVAIFEDIFAVVLLVILSNLQQGGFNLSQCLNLVFWITVFITGMLIFGRLFARRFIKLLKKIANPEIMHVCVAGLILLLSELSSGYSNALGAFLAGAIFANTRVIHDLESMVAPIRDIFTAVFFVSIGMLIDPKLLWENKWLVLMLSFLVVGGQFVSAWLGFFLSGQKPNVAFRASLPKSQIGEFSFVIASLAHTLNLDNGQLMAITVGVALFSIIAVNVLCAREDALLTTCTQRIPHVLQTWATVYQNLLLSIQTRLSGNKLLTLVRKPLLKAAVHFSLVNAVIWCNYGLCSFLEQNPLPRTEKYGIWLQRAMLLIALGLALPFMSCVVGNLNLIILTLCKQSLPKLFERLNQHAALYKIFQLIINAVATLVFVCHFELMFLESFSEELENENEKRRRAMIKMVEAKHPWNVEIRRLTVPPHSHLAGNTLAESGLGQHTQTVLLAVGRDGFFINSVPPDYTFFPGDVLLLLGNTEQLAKATQWVAVPAKQTSERNQGFDFEQLVLTDLHPLLNETLASANLRQRYGVNLVGIQRKDERIENLSPNDIFKVGDCLLLVGHRKNLDVLKNLGTATASA